VVSADHPDLRLSDAEREEALDVLSEHVRTGRLDIDEFGTRSAKVSAAKTRRDLAPLFSDLPAPLPSALVVAPAKNEPAKPSRLVSGAVPIAVIVALILFFTPGRIWLVFLVPAVVALLLAGSWSGGRRR
jgi:hypothetical protein